MASYSPIGSFTFITRQYGPPGVLMLRSVVATYNADKEELSGRYLASFAFLLSIYVELFVSVAFV